ncbi:nuclear transport factor 2 family protein [Duganella aceris]|uniref:Nuclear transport factor 2 family protein n=1 Tax=Duganella aceris TaxID=2703883 RepID=A0ABX0FH43_9BURK|nr:nuclear transport factor 2 family protein [Duganella aceris]NGZ83905.1 nuclear transport factor 2 family protein [Duganella aceris]
MTYSMRAVLLVLWMAATSAFAEPPKAVSTPADIAAIKQVTQDFQSALKTKEVLKLSSLMLNSNILWTSPASDQQVATMRKETDPNFDGVRAGGYNEFVQFVKREKKPVEEKFYNIKITQDADLAWVMFDYEFMFDGAVENYGVETWQMVKRDGRWKIYSVTWSTHFTEKKGS